MARYNSSGWHFQSQRHSDARKYGHASKRFIVDAQTLEVKEAELKKTKADGRLIYKAKDGQKYERYEGDEGDIRDVTYQTREEAQKEADSYKNENTLYWEQHPLRIGDKNLYVVNEQTGDIHKVTLLKKHGALGEFFKLGEYRLVDEKTGEKFDKYAGEISPSQEKAEEYQNSYYDDDDESEEDECGEYTLSKE